MRSTSEYRYDPSAAAGPEGAQGWPDPPRPAVWPWYAVYCVCMALLYLLCCGLGVLFLVLDPSDLDTSRVEALVTGFMLLVVCAPLMIAFAAGPLLPRRKWAWVAGLLLIAVGMTSCCCMPACIPLLMWWIKPETKTWYGHEAPAT